MMQVTREQAGLNDPVQTHEPQFVAGECLVASVVVETHPVLSNRVLVEGNNADRSRFEVWVTALQGLNVSAGDQVLLQRPGNLGEPLVTGIVHSSGSRRSVAATNNTTLTLNESEGLCIRDANGNPVLDITQTDDGPEIALHQALRSLDIPGEFSLRADAIDIAARQGEINLAASGDINATGEIIKLN